MSSPACFRISKPSAIGLHQPVFDAVVDHLDEMPGAVRPGMEVALPGARIAPLAMRRWRDVACPRRERAEDRIEPLDDRLLAADHQAIAALQPPHAAAGADIEIMDAALRCSAAARAMSSFQKRVAAVDDGVARGQQAGQFVDAFSVASPAGSISQTARGAFSRFTRSCSAADEVAPFAGRAPGSHRDWRRTPRIRAHGASAGGRYSRPSGPDRRYRFASAHPKPSLQPNGRLTAVTIHSARIAYWGARSSFLVAACASLRHGSTGRGSARRNPSCCVFSILAQGRRGLNDRRHGRHNRAASGFPASAALATSPSAATSRSRSA